MAEGQKTQLTDALYLRYGEAAALLRCSESSVRRMVAAGELPSVKLGKKLRRIPREAIDALRSPGAA